MSPERQIRRPLRALIVEDREDDLLLLLDELDRGGYDVDYVRVDRMDALEAALAASDFDIVLSDFSLPLMTAQDVLPAVKRNRPDLPCIVLSGSITEEAAVSLFRAGARDFIVKDRMTRLLPAIHRELREAAERRRLHASEEALAEAHERMQFVMDAIGVGAWEVRFPDLVTWSEPVERIHGIAPGTFEGTMRAFVAAVHPDDRERVVEALEREARDPSTSRLEYRSVWPDGSVHWIVAIGRALTGTGGTRRLVGISMDVTAQKRLEERVQQAQKMESIGNLAGGIAHDFNNLLTVILGECQLAAERRSSRAEAMSFAAIRSAAENASALTRKLLTFSRRDMVVPRVIELDRTLKAFRPVLRRLVEESVRLEFKLHAAGACVRADAGQMEQVLLNLVANARDAMPGGGTVTIETRRIETAAPPAGSDAALAAGPQVLLAVSDTGIGMPPEVKAHLFEPFFTTKAAGQGTGLGLATVHGIVTEAGGRLAVESEPGQGTSMLVYLPAVAAEAQAEADTRRAADASGGTEMVLVVEDNAALRHVTERMLRKLGYRVSVAASAAEAERIFSAHRDRIDVVLTDVVLTDGSGLTVAASFRDQRPGLPIVYMSGYSRLHPNVSGLGDAFVQKPFTMEQLDAAIRLVMSQQARGQS